jgi:hypothetical protein
LPLSGNKSLHLGGPSGAASGASTQASRSLNGLAVVGKVPNIAHSYAVPIVLALIAAANCILFSYFVEKASIRVPIYDLLDWLQFFGAHQQTGDWLDYLWTPHGQHRIVLARALVALDVRWLGGHGTAFVLFGIVLLLAAAAALCWEIVNSDLSRVWKLSAIAISILLLTPVHTVVMLGMPAMSPYLQTSAFALLSLMLLDGMAEQDGYSPHRTAAAIIAACFAAFGVSAGLVIWPVLLWSGWRGKLGWPWIATIACIGGLFTAVYLYKLPLESVSAPLRPASLLHSFDYAIRFLGLPWAHLRALIWPARLIGLTMFCVGGFALASESLAPRPSSRLRRFALGLVLFSFLVAGSAALARVDAAPDREMPIRYSEFTMLAQLGLLLWALDLLHRFWRRATRPFLQWLVVGIAFVWLCQQLVAGQYAEAEASRYNDAWSRFVAGEWTPDMLHYVYPNREHAEAGLAKLRSTGLYRGP